MLHCHAAAFLLGCNVTLLHCCAIELLHECVPALLFGSWSLAHLKRIGSFAKAPGRWFLGYASWLSTPGIADAIEALGAVEAVGVGTVEAVGAVEAGRASKFGRLHRLLAAGHNGRV